MRESCEFWFKQINSKMSSWDKWRNLYINCSYSLFQGLLADSLLSEPPETPVYRLIVKYSVQFSHSVVSDSLQHHGLQYARLSCPLPPPEACSNSCPLSQWCHPTTSSPVTPFFSNLQSFPASRSFPMSQFSTSGGQSIGASASASASVLPMNIQDWFP